MMGYGFVRGVVQDQPNKAHQSNQDNQRSKSANRPVMNSTKPSLPENFAEDLMNLELEHENEVVDITSVNKLLSLYSVAIEYFESLNDGKYLIFKNKMKGMWMKKNVQEAMERANNNIQTENSGNNIYKTQKKKELEIQMKYENEKFISDNKHLIENNTTGYIQNQSIIKNEVSTQQNDIMKRLEQRKERNKSANVQNTDKQRDVSPNFGAAMNVIQKKFIMNQSQKKQSDLSPNFAHNHNNGHQQQKDHYQRDHSPQFNNNQQQQIQNSQQQNTHTQQNTQNQQIQLQKQVSERQNLHKQQQQQSQLETISNKDKFAQINNSQNSNNTINQNLDDVQKQNQEELVKQQIQLTKQIKYITSKIEKYKEKKILEIKNKYIQQYQILQTQYSNNQSLVSKVEDKLRKEEESKIKQVEEEFDKKLIQEIEKLKQTFNEKNSQFLN